uniref:Ral transcription factor IIIC subunit 5 n=1 Tax=Oncorhynchus mykiss TaxID=8022 RepID=A0A8C7UQ04_ONCMY
MVVGARRTGLCQERQRSFPCVSRMVHHPKDIKPTGHNCGTHWSQTWASIPVECFRKHWQGGECNSILLIVAGVTDFQYLAVHSAKDGSHTSLYDKIILRKPENNEFFEQPVPLFLPPPIFSRLDSAVDYNYRPEIQHKEGHCPPTVSRDNLIGLSRDRRPHNNIFLTFNDQNIPTEPLEAAKAEEQLKEMFESRPIWSGYAVKANLDLHPDKLKLLLPIMAYYMVRRPRPANGKSNRKHTSTNKAKKYQVLDFRIRCSTKHGYTINDMPVKAKRRTFKYIIYWVYVCNKTSYANPPLPCLLFVQDSSYPTWYMGDSRQDWPKNIYSVLDLPEIKSVERSFVGCMFGVPFEICIQNNDCEITNSSWDIFYLLDLPRSSLRHYNNESVDATKPDVVSF